MKHEHLGLINSSKKSKKKGNNDCHLTKAYQLSHTHVRSIVLMLKSLCNLSISTLKKSMILNINHSNKLMSASIIKKKFDKRSIK